MVGLSTPTGKEFPLVAGIDEIIMNLRGSTYSRMSGNGNYSSLESDIGKRSEMTGKPHSVIQKQAYLLLTSASSRLPKCSTMAMLERGLGVSYVLKFSNILQFSPRGIWTSRTNSNHSNPLLGSGAQYPLFTKKAANRSSILANCKDCQPRSYLS